MKGVLKEHGFEAITGFFVVLLAIWFVIFAWQRSGGGVSNAIHVTAQFPSATGISVGTEVRIAGLKVGNVSGERLDPKSYQAELTLALDSGVKVPADSSASITSEGLLGSSYIALMPGGASAALKNGDTIIDTQGAMDMMSLIGQFINKSSGSGSSTDASAPAK